MEVVDKQQQKINQLKIQRYESKRIVQRFKESIFIRKGNTISVPFVLLNIVSYFIRNVMLIQNRGFRRINQI